ncbi:MAG: UbiA prenyltransferase family protein [Saprospiraceae bacterium]|nr:UbiA prenyltransferase family protein [Candidatus Defluviibacterium haderslevense]MBK7245794.1 UbiA prenyltransferase family protein [Candidatus Defluviibacterium haderslevense]
MEISLFRNIVTHLRFSFSILLLPVFLFAMSQASSVNWIHGFICFVVLHVLVYPSSNAYNSFMDRDTGSIGGLKNPPEVPQSIYMVSIVFDVLALCISYMFLGFPVFALIVSYIIASRTYSYRGIRLKKYPWVGFLIVALFQGSIIYLISLWSFQGSVIFELKLYWGMLISFFMMGSSYPLTQVYQHKQDREDGVLTLSMVLGVRGTFIFSGIMLFVFVILMVFFLYSYESLLMIPLLIFCTFPVSIYFINWFQKVWRDDLEANFENTMLMSHLGAWSTNLFFGSVFLFKYFNILI